MSDPMTKAVAVFGSQKEIARILGLGESAVSMWRHYGKIPDRNKLRLLTIAHERGLNLTAEDLGLPAMHRAADETVTRAA